MLRSKGLVELRLGLGLSTSEVKLFYIAKKM